MLLLFLVNQLTALNITEQKANYQKLLDTQELFIDFELGFVVSFFVPKPIRSLKSTVSTVQ